LAAAAPAPRKAAELGYAAYDAELIQTGGDGRTLFRLNAAVIRQALQNDDVRLQQVQLQYRAAQSQWSLAAQRATLLHGNENVEFFGDVRVTGAINGQATLAQIRTAQLNFEIPSETARTEQPVTLTWGGHELRGVGLFANFKDQQLRLESAVHGQFARQ
jgi:LPS export ABC transporter protein LptC